MLFTISLNLNAVIMISLAAMRVSHWKPRETNENAYRKRGRPATRWDDRLNEFTRWMWNTIDWQTACVFPDFPEQENEFVQFHSD